jgi:type I restriction enzyme S subunit
LTRKAARWRWLDDIPAHWDEGKIVHFSRLMTGGTPDRENPAFWENGIIPWLASGEVNQGRVTTPTSLITDAALKSSNATYLPVGSVLIALAGQGKTKGMVARLGISATCNQSLAAFVCDEQRLCGDYLYYYLNVNYRNLRGLVGDDLRDGLSLGLLSSLRTPIPPFPEQRRIAAFLDRKTAAIDVLIAKKERLIELLLEKRLALITQAVTKGLDLNAPMKESGVEWLGEVPAHWTVQKLRRFAKRVDVGIAEAATHAYASNGVPLIRSTNIRDGALDRGSMFFIEAWFAERNRSKVLHFGDIVTVRTGNPGVSAVVPQELEGAQCFTTLMTTLMPGHNSRFFSSFLNSKSGQTYFDLESWGSAQKNISVPILADIPTPVPPKHEQDRIVEWIDREAGVLDTMQRRVARQIELLGEYRQTLISAAVTGKIEIPGEAA